VPDRLPPASTSSPSLLAVQRRGTGTCRSAVSASSAIESLLQHRRGDRTAVPIPVAASGREDGFGILVSQGGASGRWRVPPLALGYRPVGLSGLHPSTFGLRFREEQRVLADPRSGPSAVECFSAGFGALPAQGRDPFPSDGRLERHPLQCHFDYLPIAKDATRRG
jgi:hypothetical protein